jgi:hypothetical protein
MNRWRLTLLVIGVVLTAALTTIGLLIIYNVQEDRERVSLVCDQVAELRQDILVYLDSNKVPNPNINEFRPVSCPA